MLEAYRDPYDQPEDGPRRCVRRGCGRAFTPARPQARYCCEDCRKAARRFAVAHAPGMMEAILDLAEARANRKDDAAQERGKEAWRFILARGRDLLEKAEAEGREAAECAS